MARRLTVLVSLVALLGLVAPDVAAHTVTADTRVKASKLQGGFKKRRVIIFGQLRSAEPACRVGEVVQLVRKRPRPWKVLATDVTDSEGDYLFARRFWRDVRVFVRHPRSTETSYGHSHTCLRSRSRTLSIDVR